MKQSVADNFARFSKNFEGRIHFMYLDILKKVTTGVGNLIDSIGAAQQLPWHFKNDPSQDASAVDVANEWTTVKSDPGGLSQSGGGAFESVTNLELSDEAVDDLVQRKVQEMEAFLVGRREFSDYENWPADAQLALLSMAWAMGPGFRFPNFQAACAARDFRAASAQCHMDDATNRGLRGRNDANRQLFVTAAEAEEGSQDPEEVHLPF